MKKLTPLVCFLAAILWMVSCVKDKSLETSKIDNLEILKNAQEFEDLSDLLPNTIFNHTNSESKPNKPYTLLAKNGISVTVYSSRADFMADCPDLANEDFEGSGCPFACPCSPNITSGCYPGGELLSGFDMTDNPAATLVVIADGAFGNSTAVAGPNLFGSNMELTFSGADNSGVGFDIVDVFGGNSWTVTVTGTSGVLFSGPASGSLAGTFLGFKVSGDIITQINFNGLSGNPQAELIDNLTFGQCCLEIDIDIKPGSDPNSINCNNSNSNIPVAILTTDSFDATTVDHTTVTFEGASEWHTNNQGEPKRHEDDVDNDGDVDLVLHFKLADTDLTCDSTTGTLTGETFDGQCIEGTDSVNMVGGNGN
jgi:hypothetical protein